MSWGLSWVEEGKLEIIGYYRGGMEGSGDATAVTGRSGKLMGLNSAGETHREDNMASMIMR